MSRTAQISKEKQQSIITLRHDGQSIRNISRTLKVSSSAVAKTIKRYDETGSHEDHHRKGRSGDTSAAEDTFIRVQRRLDESGLRGWIATKKPLLKDTNKNNRLAWAKKHEQWTLDRWKSVLWSDESTFEMFGSHRHFFVRRRVGERMISACVVPTVKYGGGGVMVWGCFAGDAVSDLFRIQGTLNQHIYHSILQWNAIPSGCA